MAEETLRDPDGIIKEQIWVLKESLRIPANISEDL